MLACLCVSISALPPFLRRSSRRHLPQTLLRPDVLAPDVPFPQQILRFPGAPFDLVHGSGEVVSDLGGDDAVVLVRRVRVDEAADVRRGRDEFAL